MDILIALKTLSGDRSMFCRHVTILTSHDQCYAEPGDDDDIQTGSERGATACQIRRARPETNSEHFTP